MKIRLRGRTTIRCVGTVVTSRSQQGIDHGEHRTALDGIELVCLRWERERFHVRFAPELPELAHGNSQGCCHLDDGRVLRLAATRPQASDYGADRHLRNLCHIVERIEASCLEIRVPLSRHLFAHAHVTNLHASVAWSQHSWTPEWKPISAV